MDKVLIARNRNLSAIFFRRAEQFTVLQLVPAHVSSGDDLVFDERAEIGS